ncbi:zinc finger MYM-type protein 1-like [Myzus persicae]|uniref:zinc finger MYM-type protein 1-like n=1 Tax=Myzus persicae TaxID=13164 RepID=UPI000B930AC7|nr:zinc finger MYM-type protein 1-like [Myzus persicae]
MASRDRDKFRSHPSGHQKRLKKAKVEAFMQKQRGCFEKFVSKKNEDLLGGLNSVSKNDGIENTDVNCEVQEVSNVNKNITGLQNVQNLTSPLDVQETQNTLNDRYVYDLNDPGCWPSEITHNIRIEIVSLGVKRNTHQEFPANNENPPRKFTSYHFYRTMSNGERVDREWLIYSNKKDCVYCFCCKLFLKKNCTSGLSLNGINDWKNISYSLKIHEQSINHCQSLKDWFELKTRLLSSQTIDREHLAMLEKEKNHWRNVLKRIICTVQFLSKHNDAFRGSSDKVCTKNNGKFLGLIEMMASFDDVMAEHIRRINNQETHDHYLGPEIQNELIEQMSSKVRENIIKIIKGAKYFSIMMDCTPDVSHQEQLSLIIRIVNLELERETSAPKIEEYFLDFISVESTTGLHLANLLVSKLQEYNIDLLDCRGQGYDNGSNMKGQYQGVQSRIKQLNSSAFFTPCASHNLNLLLGDISKSSTKAISFFGIVQRIYCLFSSSTKRWSILKIHCQELTLKPLSETRWECRVESIKAIRYQIPGVIKALEEVSEVTNDPKTKSEANSLVSHGIGDYEFILSLVIWYDILVQVNMVSKSLQSINTNLQISTGMLNSLLDFLKKYRTNCHGFENAKITANELAKDLDVEPVFAQKRYKKAKKIFDYERNNDLHRNNGEEIFKQEYFIVILDQAIVSMEERFIQFRWYEENFGFLFNIKNLKETNDEDLMKHCKDLQNILSSGDSKDIEAVDLYTELILFRNLVEENMTALQALEVTKKARSCFPNISIALRIILTIPVTSASAERSFSKLKLIKTYLRNTMTQNRLSGLAMLSIENEMASELNFDSIIDAFAAKKSRKKMF